MDGGDDSPPSKCECKWVDLLFVHSYSTPQAKLLMWPVRSPIIAHSLYEKLKIKNKKTKESWHLSSGPSEITYPNKRISSFNLHCHLNYIARESLSSLNVYLFCKMFPLHQGDELCFKVGSNPLQQDKIQQDQILTTRASLSGSNITNNMVKSRQRKLISMDNDNSKKKMMRRDIERQRRQEMATLYASLRSLLPLEFIKVRNLSSFASTLLLLCKISWVLCY